MLTPRFEIDTLTADADLVARVVPADDLFTLTSRSVVVPTGWSALVSRQGRDPVAVRAGTRCNGDDARDVLFVRCVPVPCTCEHEDLRSADDYGCRGAIRVNVAVPPEAAELTAFRRSVIGSRNEARVADVERHLQSQMRRALEELASRHPAAELVRAADAAELRAILDATLGPVCLSSGMVIDGPGAVRFESATYRDARRDEAAAARRSKREAARTRMQEALAAAQKKKLTHLVGMLEQMQAAGERHGGLGVADLLRSFDESERGEMYAALWHLCPSAGRTQCVAAVSGQELLRLDPSDLRRTGARVTLPDALGPLRSISTDARAQDAGLLMVGAGWGVHLVDAATGEVRRSLAAEAAPDRAIRGGVNAAAMSDDRVFATHSELGLMCWPLDAGDDSLPAMLYPELTRGADTVRCVQIADLSLWFAVDETLFGVPLDGVATLEPTAYAGSARLSAVAVVEGTAYAGGVDGQIIAFDAGDPASGRVVRGRTGDPVGSIDVVDAGGVERLIVADRSPALLAMVAGDTYCCRYESASHLIRRGAAADDLFVAMDDLRDRIIAWDPREAAGPTASAIVPHLTGDKVQDLCLIPASS